MKDDNKYYSNFKSIDLEKEENKDNKRIFHLKEKILFL